MNSRAKLFEHVPERTRRIMRAIRSTETKPELAVRRLLHSMGYRFRLHRKDLPGSPDIVLPRYRSAIFVHGCFWHQHLGCKHAKLPKQRQEYWWPKLARTQERDRTAIAALESTGWRVLTVWECSTQDRSALAGELAAFLDARLDANSPD